MLYRVLWHADGEGEEDEEGNIEAEDDLDDEDDEPARGSGWTLQVKWNQGMTKSLRNPVASCATLQGMRVSSVRSNKPEEGAHVSTDNVTPYTLKLKFQKKSTSFYWIFCVLDTGRPRTHL